MFSSSDNKVVTFAGISGYLQDKYFCEPAYCRRYVLPLKNKVVDIILFPNQLQTQNQILSTFKFTDQNQTTDTSGWKTYTDNVHVKFQYPSDWTVGTITHTPDIFTLQPTASFIPEAQTNAIVITTTNHCLNTQCLTVFTLKQEEQEYGPDLTVLNTANAKNITGDKVKFSNGNYGYWFIKGSDFVTITTDKYPEIIDKIIPTLQLLASGD